MGVNATWIGGEDKSWLSHPGLSTNTDTEGRFVLEGLAPGPWLLEPAYRSDDGWLLNRQAATFAEVLPVIVHPGAADTIPDLAMLRAVEPISPLPGAVGVDSLATFTWEAVAEADSFDVLSGAGTSGAPTGPASRCPRNFPLPRDSGAGPSTP